MEGDPFQNVIGISSNGINNETKRLEECVFGSTNFVKSSINSQKPDCKNAQFEKPSAWRDEDDDDEDESQRLAKKRAFEEAFKNKSNWAQKRADPEDEYKNSTHTYHSVDSALLPPRKLVYTNIKDLNKSNTDLARINSLEFHPSNPIAFISTNKHMLELYQLQEKNHKIISQLNVADFKAQFSHFVGTDQIMFTSTTNKCYLVYHMPESRIVKHPFIKGVDTFTRNAAGFAVSHNVDVIALLSEMGHIHLISANSRELIATLKTNGDVIQAVFSNDDQYLYCISSDGCITVFDVPSRRCIHYVNDFGCVTHPTALSLDPTGRFLATGSQQGFVNLYKTNEIHTHEHPKPFKIYKNLMTVVNKLKFNHTGEFLVMSSDSCKQSVKVAHMGTQTVFENFPFQFTKMGVIKTFDISPHSRYLAFGMKGGKALLYSLSHYKHF